MYILYAPPEKFGLIPPHVHPITPEVKFVNNYGYTSSYYWRKIHCRLGFEDVSPQKMKKFIDNRKYKTVVFLVRGGLGDCLWNMPAIKLFKEKFEKCYIFIVTDEKTKAIWQGCQYINGHAIDEIWNTQQVMSRAENVFDFGGVATIYKDQMKLDPVEAIFKELGLKIPKEKSKMRPDICMTIDEGRAATEQLANKGIDIKQKKVITIGVDASTSNRHYPIAYIKIVSKQLLSDGHAVIWLGQTEEYNEENIKEENKVEGVINFVCKTNLRMAMAIIALSDVHINPNSGLIVVSTAFNIPTIGLFGAFTPASRSKYYDKFIGLYHPTKCSPCNEHWTECREGFPAPCMKNIQPSEVYKACVRMLKDHPRSLAEKMPIS